MIQKRTISEVILHCSASPANTTVSQIRDWHKARGWKDIGYHAIITQDGLIRNGRHKDEPGAHCEGHNKNSFGICLTGGLQSNGSMVPFTKEQLIGLKILIEGLYITYGKLPIHGHHHYNKAKSCPNFRVKEWMDDGMPPTPSKYMTKTGV